MNWIPLLLPTLLGQPAGAPPPELAAPRSAQEEIELVALLVADSLEVGPEYSIELVVGLPEGTNAKGAGIPGMIVQLDVPECVELTGRRVEALADLKKNEFLEEPYERLLDEDGASLTFQLKSAPKEGDSIGINIVGYLMSDSGAQFLRRRLEVDLEPGASGREADPRNARWGTSKERLSIGDKAPSFSLPGLSDGQPFAMDTLVGKRKLVVTTYRAQW